MKKHVSLFLIALFSGVITLGGYKLFIEEKPFTNHINTQSPSIIATNYSIPNFVEGTNIDFTFAAEKTVNAVVHIKNRTTTSGPTNIFEYLYGGR